MPKLNVYCPFCYSSEVKRYGYNPRGLERFRCALCGKQFTPTTGTCFSKLRHPRQLVMYALNLYFRHGFSTRQIQAMLSKSRFRISHVAIHGWIKKLGDYYLRNQMKYPGYTKIWYLNSTRENLAGKPLMVWSVNDSQGLVLAVECSDDLDSKIPEKLLRSAMELSGFKPQALFSGVEGLNLQELIKKVYG